MRVIDQAALAGSEQLWTDPRSTSAKAPSAGRNAVSQVKCSKPGFGPGGQGEAVLDVEEDAAHARAMYGCPLGVAPPARR